MTLVGTVIPTLNEVANLPNLLHDLRQSGVPQDVLVVDGGSVDETVAVARREGARVVETTPGRGGQLRTGAAAVRGEWLLFLHADVRMPEPARAALRGAVDDQRLSVAVWRFAIDGRGTWFRIVEFGAWLRDRVGGLPYGDQGLLVRRDCYEAVGGFPSIPIMEDVALIRALRRRGRIDRFGAPLPVSARRWQREGPVRGWLRNALLVTAFLAGASPDRLARWYRPEPR